MVKHTSSYCKSERIRQDEKSETSRCAELSPLSPKELTLTVSSGQKPSSGNTKLSWSHLYMPLCVKRHQSSAHGRLDSTQRNVYTQSSSGITESASTKPSHSTDKANNWASHAPVRTMGFARCSTEAGLQQRIYQIVYTCLSQRIQNIVQCRRKCRVKRHTTNENCKKCRATPSP